MIESSSLGVRGVRHSFQRGHQHLLASRCSLEHLFDAHCSSFVSRSAGRRLEQGFLGQEWKT